MFTVSINASNIQNLIAFDLTIQYDTTVLKATNLTLTGGLFDPLPHFILKQEIIPTAGTVRVAETLLATSVNVTSAKLFLANFKMNTAGRSALHFQNSQVVTLVNGAVTSIPFTALDGQVTSPPSVVLVKTGATVAHHHLSISHYGPTQTLIGLVANEGTNPAYAKIHFTVISSSGNTTFADTSVILVAPGATVEMDAFWTTQASPDSYAGVATLIRSPDNSTFVPGESATFKFTVVL
jgi:hypothetical protein